jgi:hypothetical protein
MESRKSIKTILREHLNEVEYLKPNRSGETKKDNSITGSTIRVFFGIELNGLIDKILTVGLSGNEKIKRVNSNDTAEDTGLFVTIDFELAKRYARSGIIVEFTANINELHPVKDGASGTYNYKSGYDNLLSPTKSEALYRGELNPNMIKYIWGYNNKTDKWNRYNRKQFIEKLNINTKRKPFQTFLPNDDFDIDKIIKFYGGNTESADFKSIINRLNTLPENQLNKLFLFPKQIKQVLKLRANNYFDKFL